MRMNTDLSAHLLHPVWITAMAVAVDPDGGTAGKSIADVLRELRARSREDNDIMHNTAEVDAAALADLIEALAQHGALLDD